MLRLMPSFLPPGVSGDGDAGGVVVLQRLQGGEETSLQTNCLGQTRQLQVGSTDWGQLRVMQLSLCGMDAFKGQDSDSLDFSA